jgi:hypothetical protein
MFDHTVIARETGACPNRADKPRCNRKYVIGRVHDQREYGISTMRCVPFLFIVMARVAFAESSSEAEFGPPPPSATLDESVRRRLLESLHDNESRVAEMTCHAKIVAKRQIAREVVTADFSAAALAKLKRQGVSPYDEQTILCEYALSGERALETGVKPNGKRFVLAVNDRYAFGIERPEQAAEYSLQWLEPTGSDSTVDEKVAMRRRHATHIICGSWMLFDQTLKELVEHPEFRMTSAEEFQRDDRPFVRVGFERPLSIMGRGMTSLNDGYFVLEINRSWALREYAATMGPQSQPGTRRWIFIEFGEDIGGFPIAKTYRMVDEFLPGTIKAGKPVISTGTTTVELLDRNPPEELFQLSHYGLPEPRLGGGFFGRGWIWIVAGIGCLAVAVRLRRLRAA